MTSEKKDEDGWFAPVAFLVCCLVALIVGVFAGYDVGQGNVRREAVRHGAAEYIISEFGNIKFQWNDEKPKDKK